MLIFERRVFAVWIMPLAGVSLYAGLFLSGAAHAGAQVPAVEGLAETRSMDLTVDGRALHALVAGRFEQRDTLAYLRSWDGGKTWSKPTFVDRPGDPRVLSRRGNDVRLAVHGRRIVAVWQVKGELPGTGPLVVAVSADGGRTWRRSKNPAVGDSLHNQSFPALAADRMGRFHLAWLDDREENGNTQGLRYAWSADGLDWKPEMTLDPAVCTCCWPRIGALPDGGLAVLYRDADPQDMHLLRGVGHGEPWRDLGPVGVSGWRFTGCPHCGGGLAVTGSTVLHGVTWTGKENLAGFYYSRSDDLGKTWAPPVSLGGGHSKEGDIAARSVSELAVAYTRPGATGTAIEFRRSRDGGRHWSAALELTRPDADADHPRIAATPWGFRVFWTEARPGGHKVLAMAAPAT